MPINRRDFIKTSALGSGLVALTGGKAVLAMDGRPAKLKNCVQIKKGFAFCVIADPHCVEPALTRYTKGLKRNGKQTGNGVEKFFNCLEEIRNLRDDEKPDFILIAGDVHLWALEQHLDKVKIPMHVISGNHEDRDGKRQMRELFPSDFKIDGHESDYYSFVHKGVRFIGLCDAKGGDHIGTLCSEDFGPRGQCEWLEKELAQREQHKIIFSHIPPELNGRDKNMYLSRNDSRYFNNLIKQRQPTAMFFGHQHLATQYHNIGNTKSFTVRSSCWNDKNAPIGFMVVKISADGIVIREIFTGHYDTDKSE